MTDNKGVNTYCNKKIFVVLRVCVFGCFDKPNLSERIVELPRIGSRTGREIRWGVQKKKKKT